MFRLLKSRTTNNESTTLSHDFDMLPYFPHMILEDEVHMANDEERREYVMRQNGWIYRGNKKYQVKKDWYYGQVLCNFGKLFLGLTDLQ